VGYFLHLLQALIHLDFGNKSFGETISKSSWLFWLPVQWIKPQGDFRGVMGYQDQYVGCYLPGL